MKKIFYILIIACIFFKIDVFAFRGDYNYEVTQLNRDLTTHEITIKGWAILNANGNCDSSGCVWNGIPYSSGSAWNCTGNNDNYYYYTLYAAPSDGQPIPGSV